MFRFIFVSILLLGFTIRTSDAQEVTFEAKSGSTKEFKLKTEDENAQCLIENAIPEDEKLAGEIFEALSAGQKQLYKKKIVKLFRSAAVIGTSECGFTDEYIKSKAFYAAVSSYSLSFGTFVKN